LIVRGWQEWSKDNLPNICYKTCQRYIYLYENWTDLSSEQRDACETLNQAYLACGVTKKQDRVTVPKKKRAKATEKDKKEPVTKSGDGLNGWTTAMLNE
jgi:hypothetical protein